MATDSDGKPPHPGEDTRWGQATQLRKIDLTLT
jgi:hypothetical protein